MEQVVGQIIPGAWMYEDRELAAVERKPLDHVAEAFPWDRQLAAAARMGAHRPRVDVAHGKSEAASSRLREDPRRSRLIRVEVQVSMEVTDHRRRVAGLRNPGGGRVLRLPFQGYWPSPVR